MLAYVDLSVQRTFFLYLICKKQKNNILKHSWIYLFFFWNDQQEVREIYDFKYCKKAYWYES